MKEQLLQELKAIAATVNIKNGSTFTFNGEEYALQNQQPYYQNYLPFNRFGENKPFPGSPHQDHQLINRLAQILYNECYCFPFGKPKAKQTPTDKPDEIFIQNLSQANQTRDDWDYGWTIYNTNTQGQAFAQKNGQLMPLVANEYQFAHPSHTTLQPQTPVNIKIKKEDKFLMPGFYFAYSQVFPDHTSGLVRLYWHIQSQGVATLLYHLSFSFNQYKIPYWFKCLNHPQYYQYRTDSAVLYLGQRYFKIANEIIREFQTVVEPYLTEETPLFTRKLAPGIAFAEDPMDGSSFGQQRTQLLAQALVSAHDKKYTTPNDILNEIELVFQNHGIQLNTPYLNPNSHYQYHFSILNKQLQTPQENYS